VKLVIISIGKPEVGKELCEHLGVENGDQFVFADPENALYNDLKLNQGPQTFFAPDTAFAFRDRMFGETGLSDLMEVLGKWSSAVYIPPKTSQAFIQGGSFIFDGPKTLFAHYDASTGAHADMNQVISIALDATK